MLAWNEVQHAHTVAPALAASQPFAIRANGRWRKAAQRVKPSANQEWVWERAGVRFAAMLTTYSVRHYTPNSDASGLNHGAFLVAEDILWDVPHCLAHSRNKVLRPHLMK